MQLIRTRRSGRRGGSSPQAGARDLAADARAMRRALDDLNADQQRVHGPRSEVRLREIVRDLLEGEVEAPTTDVAKLTRGERDPEDFYTRVLAPSWEGLTETQRAGRVDGFLELAQMIDAAGAVPGLVPEDVRTKALILAWAFDETYGYLPRLGRGNAG